MQTRIFKTKPTGNEARVNEGLGRSLSPSPGGPHELTGDYPALRCGHGQAKLTSLATLQTIDGYIIEAASRRCRRWFMLRNSQQFAQQVSRRMAKVALVAAAVAVVGCDDTRIADRRVQ